MNVTSIDLLAAAIHKARVEGRKTSMALALAVDAGGMYLAPRERAELEAYRALDLGDVDGRVLATCSKGEHPTWLDRSGDPRGCPWCELQEVETSLLRLLPTERCPEEGLPTDLAAVQGEHGAWQQVAEVLGVTLPYERPADEDPIAYELTAAAGKVTRGDAGGITRADDEPAVEVRVYRAEYEHDITPLETYTTPAAARRHCETEARQEEARERASFDLVWQDDPDDDEVKELWAGTGPDDAERTGYLVRSRVIATEYDPGADQ